jgi:hypothetical protein
MSARLRDGQEILAAERPVVSHAVAVDQLNFLQMDVIMVFTIRPVKPWVAFFFAYDSEALMDGHLPCGIQEEVSGQNEPR